ncbi:MAG TPA: MFS transporter [Candidatus Limnocylindria bacterium]|nr:MFS transporter [Candidatus Limnocylindria bacterium]
MSDARAGGQGIWSGQRQLLTVGLIGLVTAVAFEGLAVSTVLPATAADLRGLGLYGWAFSAFWLTNILGITLGGGDADRHGPWRAFLAGVGVFALGLGVAAAATGMPMLIAARAIQGFGSGAIGAVVYVVIARAYPAALHPRMLAIISTAWVVPGLIGPALAAWIAETLHWRWVFGGLTVPVLLLAVVAFRPIMALQPVPGAGADRGRRAWEALRLSVGSLLFLSGLTIGSLPVGIVMSLAGAALTVLALRHLLPPGALRLVSGPPAVPMVVFATAFAFFGAEVYIPLAITDVRHASLAAGALAISAATLTWTAGSWLQARLVPRGWRRGLVGIGTLLIAVGILVTALILLPAMPLYVAAIGWAIGGLGMGLAYTTLSLLMLESAEPGREGSASAALQLTFTLGTAFGTGVGGAWVALADGGVISLAAAIGIAFGLTLVVVLLAAGGSLRLPRAGRQRGAAPHEAFDPAAVPPVP